MIEFDSSVVKDWSSRRVGDIEVFTTPQGEQYTRCSAAEEPSVVIHFTRIPGLPSLRLRRLGESTIMRRAAKRARKAQRELSKRGY